MPAPFDELAHTFGDDLAALVRGYGAPLVAHTPLSQRGDPPRATAFRLRFADGCVLKGWHAMTAEQAEQAAAVAAALPHVPRVVARAGRALLSDWVEGSELARDAPDEALVRRCGALQAAVHALPIATLQGPTPHSAVRNHRQRLREHLDTLQQAAALAREECETLWTAACAHAPERGTVALILGDFCAENVVQRADGSLVVIDIETLDVNVCEFDLARTWYRWPMTPAQRAAYLDGYGPARAAPFLAHAPFWLIVALTNGAAFRYRERADTLRVPLARLRAVLRALADGTAPLDAA